MSSEITPLTDAIQASENQKLARFERNINPEFASMLSTLGLEKTFVTAHGTTVQDMEG
ncbi:hypothetical protein [Halodesulfurarchaeum sp.]|uniref:hypothetical protein n=1 Tax=Halodesulfurarchaeum sp. TaxID=1980530 RepID=UPI002FC2B795